MSEINPSTVPALLRVENLRVSFKGENKEYIETVKGVSFEIPANTTVALVGESGSGKSVTSLATMGLLPAESARISKDSQIIFEGKNLLKLKTREMRQMCGKDIAMIFQEPMSSLNPVFTVGMQIAEILQLHLGMNKKQARQRTLELLKEVGIPAPETKIDAYPGQLSGGQQEYQQNHPEHGRDHLPKPSNNICQHRLPSLIFSRDFIKESFAVRITTQEVFHHLLAMLLSALSQDRITIMRTDFLVHELITKG